MKTLIIDNGTTFLHSLIQLSGPETPSVKSYASVNPEDALSYDLIILSGGHRFPVVGHEQELEKEIYLMQHSPVPILGICYGFEIIAHSYGAKMHRMKVKEKSILKITPERDDPIFDGLTELSVYESHRQVITNAGGTLMSLARSRDGIEIIKHPKKLIYGFQFHPEMFPEKTQGDELFANFVKIVQNRK